MEIKQQLRQTQQLVMTPQLQQAIKLLQMSRMELVDLVREEMLENPVLEDQVETGEVTSQGVETATPEASSIDALTSAAVKRWPSWKRTPRRSSNSQVRALTRRHEVARPGCGRLRSPLGNSTRWS